MNLGIGDSCQGEALTFVLSVTAEAGYDEENAVYYYGTEATATATISRTALSVPELSSNANGVTWESVEHADAYLVRIDDGEAQTITTRPIALLTETGAHTVDVKAVSSDPMYAASASAR